MHSRHLPFSSLSDTDILQCLNSSSVVHPLRINYLQNFNFEPFNIQDKKYNSSLDVNKFILTQESVMCPSQNTSFLILSR